MWEVKTLNHAIKGGYLAIPAKVGPDGRAYYKCQCKRVVQAKDILDLRGVSGIGRFVCDGCKENYIRTGDTKGRGQCNKTREQRKEHLMRGCGCPADVMEKFKNG